MLGHAKVIGILFRTIPVRLWKDRLARHIECCPFCQSRLAGLEETRRVLFQARDAGGLDGLWPSVRRAIHEGAPVPARGVEARPGPAGILRGWRWAAASVGLAAAVLVTAGLIRTFLSGTVEMSRTTGQNEEFRVHYARIAGEPAQTIVFADPDDKTIIVWVDRIL